VKQQLSPGLRNELCYHIYGKVLRRLPFLACMRGFEDCYTRLAASISSMFLSPGDFIFRQGQPGDTVYMLLKGSVRLTLNHRVASQELSFSRSLAQTMRIEGHEGEQSDDEMQIPRSSSSFSIAQTLEKELVRKSESMRRISASVDNNEDIEVTKSTKNLFDLEILNHAYDELRLLDERQSKAALRIQRFWREREWEELISEGEHTDQQHSRSGKALKSDRYGFRTRVISAPAYMGESCLWHKFEEWDLTPVPSHTYSSSCESLSELIRIPREAIQDVIIHFSPWLKPRFELFRRSMLECSHVNAKNPVSESEDGNEGSAAAVVATAATAAYREIESNDANDVANEYEQQLPICGEDAGNMALQRKTCGINRLKKLSQPLLGKRR